MAKKTAEPQVVDLKMINISMIKIRLVGDSPLICHAWSSKAKKMMLDKQMKKTTVKTVKDPQKDYEESLYVLNGGKVNEKGTVYGFPAVAFKAASVSACRNLDMKMTMARGAYHVVGDMIVINGEPSMREDMVRVGMGTADIRYRGEFREWSADVTIRYNEDVISPEQIINLFNVAGFAVGVGEWRPEKNGGFGMFHVEGDA